MRRGAVGIALRHAQRAVNTWSAVCARALRTREQLSFAAGQWRGLARARPFRTWARQQQRGARARKLLQRVSMGALFGATAMWSDGARRWSQRMRRRRLGVHRWIGNACALALVRWRQTVATRSLPHRALEAWRRMGRARALRTWVAFAALDENTLLLYMATAAEGSVSYRRAAQRPAPCCPTATQPGAIV